MLTYDDWQQIQNWVNDAILNSHGPMFSQGTVTKADPVKNLVWLDEFGGQPIPIFGFSYNVKSYDTQPNGTLTVRHVTVTPQCPNVGDIVLVARQHGSRRLPKCLGVLRSIDFVVP